MLKGQQFLNTVKFDKQCAIQVNHLVKPHHPDTVISSIDQNFVQNIESKRTANLEYFNRMKALETDQLDMGLMEYQKKKQVTQMQKENDRKDYRERVNGILGEIEKNMMNRSRMFQSELFKQSEKQKRFVDDNAIKERKISQHVNRNIDSNIFNYESDRYQQLQNMEHSQTIKTMGLQRQEMEMRREEERRAKEMQIKQRQQFQKNLEYQRFVAQQEKIKNREGYRLDLQKLVEQKNEANKKKPQPAADYRRHNPITNPIEYHIENPYILKRLEKYQ